MNNKKIYIIIVIIILITGLSFAFFYVKNNKTKKQIDVIDIECKNDNCKKIDKDKKDENKKTIKNDDNSLDDTKTPVINNNDLNNDKNNVFDNNSKINLSVNSSITSNFSSLDNYEKIGELIVSDNEHVWNSQSDLKIFNVSSVSPQDSGSYDFAINNNTNRFVKYNIVFDEINEYNVNMLYKLKRNGEYVAGDEDTYVKYSELNLSDKELKINDKDYYTIEWKWIESSNDLEVGRIASKNKVTYTIKVTINSFEEVIEKGDNPRTGDNIINYMVVAIISIISFIIIFSLKNREQ